MYKFIVICISIFFQLSPTTFAMEENQGLPLTIQQLLKHHGWQDKTNYPPRLFSPTIGEILFPQTEIPLLEKISILTESVEITTRDSREQENAPLLVLLLSKEIANLFTNASKEFEDSEIKEALYRLYFLIAPHLANVIISDFNIPRDFTYRGSESLQVYLGQNIAEIFSIPSNVFKNKTLNDLSFEEGVKLAGFMSLLVLTFDVVRAQFNPQVNFESNYGKLMPEVIRENALLSHSPEELSLVCPLPKDLTPQTNKGIHDYELYLTGTYGEDYPRKNRDKKKYGMNFFERFGNNFFLSKDAWHQALIASISPSQQNTNDLLEACHVNIFGGKESDQNKLYNMVLDILNDPIFQNVRSRNRENNDQARELLYKAQQQYKAYNTLQHGIVRRSVESYIKEQHAHQEPAKLMFFCGHQPTYGFYLVPINESIEYHTHSGWYTANIDLTLNPDLVASFGGYPSSEDFDKDRENYEYFRQFPNSFSIIYEEGHSLPRTPTVFTLLHTILKPGGIYIGHGDGSDLTKLGFSKTHYFPITEKPKAKEEFLKFIPLELHPEIPEQVLSRISNITIAYK